LDTLVQLFVDDVRVGAHRTGRAVFKLWYSQALRTVGPTIHFVDNHTIDLPTGTGIVYCREEVQDLHTGGWRAGMLQYWDHYERRGATWLFAHRKVYPGTRQPPSLVNDSVPGPTR
jgi:hypothetical protein